MRNEDIVEQRLDLYTFIIEGVSDQPYYVAAESLEKVGELLKNHPHKERVTRMRHLPQYQLEACANKNEYILYRKGTVAGYVFPDQNGNLLAGPSAVGYAGKRVNTFHEGISVLMAPFATQDIAEVSTAEALAYVFGND